jgi:hypothetical protein
VILHGNLLERVIETGESARAASTSRAALYTKSNHIFLAPVVSLTTGWPELFLRVNSYVRTVVSSRKLDG